MVFFRAGVWLGTSNESYTTTTRELVAVRRPQSLFVSASVIRVEVGYSCKVLH